MDSWHALQVATGREADVAVMLRRCGIQSIAPIVWRYERKDGHWQYKNRCAIPGYVFVRCQMTTPLYYHLTRKPGVVRLLGVDGGRYMAIPDEQINWIDTLHRMTGDQDTAVSHGARSADGEITITDGPLLALQDKITKIDARRRRATVTLALYDDVYDIDLAVEITDDKQTDGPTG